MDSEFVMNNKLLEYVMSNVKIASECDIEEKANDFPYTRSTSLFFQKLKKDYNIDFDADLISPKLLDNIINEIITNLPK